MRYCSILPVLTLVVAQAVQAAGLDEILPDGATVKKIVGNVQFTEGAAWCDKGFLVFSDIPANLIYRWNPDGTVEILHSPSGHANGNAFDKEGRLVSCQHDRRVVRWTGTNFETIAERFEGKRLNSPNDLAIKSDGSIYFTDPGFGLKNKADAELDFHGVFRIAPDGKLTLLARDFGQPNGIAFSLDERHLYVADSGHFEVRIFDVNEDGTISNGRIFAEMHAEKGGADGMRLDAKGNVYLAGTGGVWVFTPDGTKLGVIATAEKPTNLSFGGPDRKTLFITARPSVYSISTKIGGPSRH